MATKHRKRATDIANLPIPNLPQLPPKDWPPGLYGILRDLLRSLEISNEVIFGIQDNGTKMPLRSDLDFIGASVTDDLANDRTIVSIGGGAGAAPVNATYIVVSLNGTLTNERTLAAGAGLTSTDGGANGAFTLNVGAGTGITVSADDVAITATAVTPASYGSATSVATFTVNQQGQITLAASVPIVLVPSYARELMLMGA